MPTLAVISLHHVSVSSTSVSTSYILQSYILHLTCTLHIPMPSVPRRTLRARQAELVRFAHRAPASLAFEYFSQLGCGGPRPLVPRGLALGAAAALAQFRWAFAVTVSATGFPFCHIVSFSDMSWHMHSAPFLFLHFFFCPPRLEACSSSSPVYIPGVTRLRPTL
ncbi:hypothetical protein OH76DRAFT_700889 [Lentinus brumalis]|uniref:Uncharacterized protein n=1 Tax=Lentinus brumalis TaxID=2498619 RepID=A0A371D5P2_9APHY|nr:hypothetical protein OH76DRAFT_700889 [Polyporus brumalis]